MRKQAFTLVELLIGVTISSIVLTVAMVFLSSGIENAYRIRKSLNATSKGSDFRTALSELQAMGGTVKRIGAFDAPYGTGVLLGTPNGHSPLTFFGTVAATGVCDAFSGTVADPGPKERLVVAEYFATPESGVSGDFRLEPNSHVLKRSDGTVVLGTGTPGKAGGDGDALATELRYPSSVAAHAGGAFVADTGNDRILFFSGGTVRTFVGTRWGWRFPRSLAVAGGALWLAEGRRVLKMEDSTETGTAFSATYPVTGTGIQFNAAQVSVIPVSAGTFPSSNAAYSFGGHSPTSVSIASGVATLAFSGASLPAGNRTFGISPMTPPTAPNGYSVRVVLTMSGVTVFDRPFPYFTRGDGRLETLEGNVVSVVADSLPFPNSVSDSGYLSDIVNPPAFPSVANAAVRSVSERLVENVAMSASGGILTVSYVEYVDFDCVSGRHAKRQKIAKIPLR